MGQGQPTLDQKRRRSRASRRTGGRSADGNSSEWHVARHRFAGVDSSRQAVKLWRTLYGTPVHRRSQDAQKGIARGRLPLSRCPERSSSAGAVPERFGKLSATPKSPSAPSGSDCCAGAIPVPEANEWMRAGSVRAAAAALAVGLCAPDNSRFQLQPNRRCLSSTGAV